MGGMFVLHVLFRQPEAFSHYIAAAPVLEWDQRAMFRNEQAYAAHHDSLPAKLYLATGLLDGHDMLTNVAALVDTLTVREYKGFQWEVSFLEGETHRSVIPVVFSDGLRWIFPDSTR